MLEGRPGAAASIVENMRGRWVVTPAVQANRNMDVVHRVIGQPGVILLSEGPRSRVGKLIGAEKKRISRAASEVPIYDIQVGNDEERALILQATGIAYRVMNKPEEALNNYKESLKIQRRLGQKRGVAASLNEMAQVYEVLGKPREALASFNEAIEVRREIGAKKEVGDTLIDLGSFYEDRGQHDRALQMYKESLQIQREAGDETYQALCLNNIGGVYEAQSKYDDALTYFQQALQLREKLKVPGDIADTLHNLAETNARMGSYEQALSQYLRALDFYRTSGDKRGAAVDSHALGILFGYQGRYGAALNAEEEALKIFRELQDRSVLMLHILTGYGEALSQIGRGSEAEKTLEEAMSFARELKNDALLAQVLNLQGGSFFYRGDFKMARVKYDSALRSASQAKDANQTMLSKFNLARLDVTGGRSREAISHLKAVAREADRVGLKYLSAESSVSLAEALVNTKAYPQARHELETALMKSEKLGLRALGAKIHYLLGTTLRLTGNETEAARQYGEALRLLGEIRKEKGTDKLMERSDLSAIFAESSHWSQGKPE